MFCSTCSVHSPSFPASCSSYVRFVPTSLLFLFMFVIIILCVNKICLVSEIFPLLTPPCRCVNTWRWKMCPSSPHPSSGTSARTGKLFLKLHAILTFLPFYQNPLLTLTISCLTSQSPNLLNLLLTSLTSCQPPQSPLTTPCRQYWDKLARPLLRRVNPGAHPLVLDTLIRSAAAFCLSLSRLYPESSYYHV